VYTEIRATGGFIEDGVTDARPDEGRPMAAVGVLALLPGRRAATVPEALWKRGEEGGRGGKRGRKCCTVLDGQRLVIE